MTTTGVPEAGGTPAGPEFRRPPRRRSIVGPIILIGFGVLFLMGTIRPDFDPWWVFWHYWPLLLIFIGLGQIFDHYWNRNPDGTRSHGLSGTAVGLIVLLVIVIALGFHGSRRSWDNSRDWGWGRGWSNHDWGEHILHDTQSIDLQGAKRVSADIDMPAGQIRLSGNSTGKLLDASFDYDDNNGKPNVDYSVSGDLGQLNISQDNSEHTHWGASTDNWELQVARNVPLDLKVEMGAGQGALDLHDVDLSGLEVHIGAGELHLNLTGPRTSDLDVTIQGGVGSAVIRLPKDVGVRVNASGGIGSVNAHGLQHDGDAYVNAAYGKTPATINMTVEGGVGEITLDEE